MDPESAVSSTTGLPAGWTPQDVLAKLPPFPDPDRSKQAEHRNKGLMSITFQCVAVGAMAAWGNSLLENRAPLWYLNFVNYTVACEVILAWVCFFYVMFMVPAPLERNQQTALPLPKEVANKLVSGQELVFAQNIKDKDIGTYCVRCFVWRRKPVCKPQTGVTLFWSTRVFHHCKVCQRCHWNHAGHNPFGGTCIAGEGFGGNLGAFRVLHFMGTLGAATAALVLVPGLWYTEMGRYAMYVVLFGINSLIFAFYWSHFDQLSYLCGKPKADDNECVATEWVLGDSQIWRGRTY